MHALPAGGMDSLGSCGTARQVVWKTEAGSRVSIGPLRQPGGDRRQTEPDTAAACAGVGLSCHSPPHSRYQHQIRPKSTQKAGAVKTRAAEGDVLGRKYKIRGGEGQKDGLTHDLDRRGTTSATL